MAFFSWLWICWQTSHWKCNILVKQNFWKWEYIDVLFCNVEHCRPDFITVNYLSCFNVKVLFYVVSLIAERARRNIVYLSIIWSCLIIYWFFQPISTKYQFILTPGSFNSIWKWISIQQSKWVIQYYQLIIHWLHWPQDSFSFIKATSKSWSTIQFHQDLISSRNSTYKLSKCSLECL